MKKYRMMRDIKKLFVLFIGVLLCGNMGARERVELLPCGDFEQWSEENIKESNIIGGKTKTLYRIGGIWDTSNAHASAFGIDKVSVTVCPEKRGEGWCCKMQSTLEEINAAGIRLKAIATGSIFIGDMLDIVGMKQSSDPNSAIDMGVPFTGKPVALMLDYKATILDGDILYGPARTKVKKVPGRDHGHVTLVLQHRWEEDGHVYAYRVGTAVLPIQESCEWQNGFRIPVVYGEEGEALRALSRNRQKTHNSKGKMVHIEEIGWRGEAEPTHMIIQISAGCQMPFTACPGNTIWVDNIRLVYAQ